MQQQPLCEGPWQDLQSFSGSGARPARLLSEPEPVLEDREDGALIQAGCWEGAAPARPCVAFLLLPELGLHLVERKALGVLPAVPSRDPSERPGCLLCPSPEQAGAAPRTSGPQHSSLGERASPWGVPPLLCLRTWCGSRRVDSQVRVQGGRGREVIQNWR